MTHLVALGDVATIERTARSPERIESGTLYVGLENIERGGEFVDVRPVNAGELGSAKFDFTNRHILYGKLRPYLAKIALPTFTGVCSTDIVPILPGDAVDRDYLCRYLRQPTIVDLATSRSVGANLPRLNPSELAKFPVPLPSVEEQRRIAAVLDQADDLRAKRRAALALLDSLTESAFVHLFGDPIANNAGWELLPLGELGALDRGVSRHRPRNAPELLGGPYPLIQTGEVANSGGYIRTYSATYSALGLQQSKMWPAGTLCITIAANIARTGVLTFDACFPDSVVGFTVSDRGNVEYVRAVLSFFQKRLENAAPESAQKNINLRVLRELLVPAPPRDLMERFSQGVREAMSASEEMVESSGLLDTLFASLQQRAFSGQM